MIKLNELQIQKIRAATLAEYPHEMCGVLTADDFIQIDNVNADPERSFSMQSMQYARVVDQAVAIVHSHIKTPNHRLNIDARTPSLKDLHYQKMSGIPWLIVATEGVTVTPPLQFPREPSNQYIGRDFIWHINDCYTLAQDFYHFELGIDLPDADPSVDPVNDDLTDVFADYIADYGFKDVLALDDVEEGDLVLLNTMGVTKNHLAIFHNGQLLHQMQKSKLDPVSHFIGQINRILRYEN